MEKSMFKFYQDQKVVIWRRDWFAIEADTKEDAIKRVRELGLDKTDVYNVLEDDMYTLDTDYLYDTEELISVEENDGQPTIEVYYADSVCTKDELICGNAD